MSLVFVGLLAGIAVGAFATYAPMAARVPILEAGISDFLDLIDDLLGAGVRPNAPHDAKTCQRKSDDWLGCGIRVVDPDGRTVGTALVRLPSPN